MKATRSKIALALSATLLVQGCAIYGTELTSIPTVGPEIASVHDCPRRSSVSYEPRSGAQLCFAIRDVNVQVEARNAETVAGAIGPFPLVPFFRERRPSTPPLVIELGFKADGQYVFYPWQAWLETARGETVRVSAVSANVLDGNGVHTVALDPRDTGPRPLAARTWNRLFLIFDQRVRPEQSFALTVHLIAADGADVQVPIRFKEGKVSYLDTIP